MEPPPHLDTHHSTLKIVKQNFWSISVLYFHYGPVLLDYQKDSVRRDIRQELGSFFELRNVCLCAHLHYTQTQVVIEASGVCASYSNPHMPPVVGWEAHNSETLN